MSHSSSSVFIRSTPVEGLLDKGRGRMTIEMQLGGYNTQSNLFIQPHLQPPPPHPPRRLLSFPARQTNKYIHTLVHKCTPTRTTRMCRCTYTLAHIHFMKETEVLCLSRRWNLEKWKHCICILICPQSGIVFGVGAKLPGVCSSSLFIGAPWKTGPKFKSGCYHGDEASSPLARSACPSLSSFFSSSFFFL